MDGMNFGGHDWRPDEDKDRNVLENPGRDAVRALAIFVVIVLAALAGIVVQDRLGVPFSTPEIGAGP